jgi:hypothetical protein
MTYQEKLDILQEISMELGSLLEKSSNEPEYVYYLKLKNGIEEVKKDYINDTTRKSKRSNQ